MAPDTGPAVALSGVRRGFGNVVAVDDLTFDVPRGTVTVLLGPNGAGKTTVVRLVTGALHAHAGAVRTLGLDPDVADEGTEVRRRCGVVPARPALYDRLSGTDNLALRRRAVPGGAEAHATSASPKPRTDSASPTRSTRRSAATRPACAPGSRSARAVLHEPDLLLLDEPTAGLDPESARTVLGLIDEMAEDGKTVLMCTHLLLEAEGLADQVIVMDHGQAMISGSPRELTRQFWPAARVVIDADDPSLLDVRAGAAVRARVPPQRRRDRRARATRATCPISSTRSSAPARASRRVEPQAPTLEELYFAIRREHS